jgi:predicted NAD/FAD-dependent oxidoreductase
VNPRIAIIGAGMAGAACARTLVDGGLAVTVFDKGRGPGGRMSTRRVEAMSFDHGAAAFEASSPQFRAEVQRWSADGLVAPWPATAAIDESTTWVGRPSMNRLCQHLLTGVSVHTGVQVRSVSPSGAQLRVSFERERADELFDAVVCTVPSPQVPPILGSWAELVAAAEAVPFEAQWVAMLAFSAPVAGAATLIQSWADNSVIASAWREPAKPARDSFECWTVQTSADFTARYLEDSAPQVADRVLAAFGALDGVELTPLVMAIAHRWRYARPARPLRTGPLTANDGRLVVAGDWTADGTVDGAWCSGVAAADRVLALWNRAA